MSCRPALSFSLTHQNGKPSSTNMLTKIIAYAFKHFHSDLASMNKDSLMNGEQNLWHKGNKIKFVLKLFKKLKSKL